MTLRSLVFASLAAVAACASAHASTFDLSGSIGATPTFTVTSGGVTATYSSQMGNGFQVQNTAGVLSFNTGLLDSNFFGTDPLTISFSAPVSGTILIPFAILDFFGTTDSLTVMANTGQMASFLGVGDGLGLDEPEGIASFALNGAVNSITLTAPDAFAIGNVSTVTPEPSSIVLLVTGVAGIVMRRRWA